MGQVNGHWLNGSVSAVAVYNVALSASSRRGHSNAGVSGALDRQVATLSGNSCGTYGAWTSVNLSSGNDTVSTGQCVQYRFRASDKVGNTATYTSGVTKVDTTPPPAYGVSLSESSAYEYTSGTTVYYNGQGANSGSFTVSASPTDAESS